MEKMTSLKWLVASLPLILVMVASSYVSALSEIIKSADGAEIVLVPAGEFVMGSNDDENERPRHRVYLARSTSTATR
jgi:formylglycine-generating enzyme required for sulfatase activity